MIKLNIIVTVHEPPEWVNSIVAIEKPDGSLRLCLDPQDLNKAIKRPYYNLPTTEELLAQMSKAKYFTKLDASCAYWQIQLDYESSKLLTFNSPYDRFRFLRMAYGIKSASSCSLSMVHDRFSSSNTHFLTSVSSIFPGLQHYILIFSSYHLGWLQTVRHNTSERANCLCFVLDSFTVQTSTE